MKSKKLSRIISVILCIAIVCTVAVQGVSVASADSKIDLSQELLSNAGFEDRDIVTADGGTPVGFWEKWPANNVARGQDVKRSGDYAAVLTSNATSLNQAIDRSKLTVGVTYEFTVYAKLSAELPDGANPSIGVKNYGGSQVSVPIDSTDWKPYSIKFKYTDAGSDPIVFAYVAASGGLTTYIDDASVKAVGDIASAEASNGSIKVKMSDSFGGTVSAGDFSAVYTSSLDPDSPRTLDLNGTPSDGGIDLSFTPIKASAAAQTITVSLTYKETVITLDFVIGASEEDISVAMIKDIKVNNGKLDIYLTDAPTIAPKKDDFTFGLKIDGAESGFTVLSYNYDSAAKTVNITFPPVSSVPNTQRTVDVTVAYNGLTASASYNVSVQRASSTYYVSSTDGDDNNDGLSEDKPFASIEKLNTIAFVPGDRILFKKGDSFTGTFKPQGSGIEGYPITVSSYGEGERPVLMPGEPWHMRLASANASVDDAVVGGSIYLYNVEYWEIRDIELKGDSYDPNFYATSKLTVYNAGIRVHNVNAGDLTHFVFDNLVIHGFRGPGTNLGKTSGGIQFNVDIDPNDRSADVQSTFVDVSITNNEIYECGRGGVNFLNVWGGRKAAGDSDWDGTSYGSLPYNPVRGFYMADNLIHHIDGDALIVDCCSGAVIENNLVYQTAIHLNTGSAAAVGLFNWNSDDTVFQYNEMYDVGMRGTKENVSTGEIAQGVTAQDAHGIEVDALNNRTWVQYNYSHDNGAFMMLCCEGQNYKSMNTYIRYNISERDGCNESNPSKGHFFNGNWGLNTEVYNNVIYLDEKVLNSAGQAFLFNRTSYQTPYKFYNNIIYYGGETPVEAANWADDANDWQSNIIVGFTNKPVDDNAENPNIYLDPDFAGRAGSGETGTVAGVINDLSCYSVSADSPAVDAGVVLESMSDGVNSGVDFAGHIITNAPDIGAFEYGIYPAAPENAAVSQVTDTSADITWTAPEDETVTGYVVKIGEEEIELPADAQSCALKDLEPGTRYTVLVYSSNGNALSAVSRLVFTTAYSVVSEGNGYMLGDVDANTEINASDATLVLQHFAKIIDLGEPEAEAAEKAVTVTSAPAPDTEGLVFHEENITVDTDDGVSLSGKPYAQNVMAMQEGTIVISFADSDSTNVVQSLFSVADDTTSDHHFHIYVTPAGVIGMEARYNDNVNFTTEAVLNPVGEENIIAVKYSKDAQTYTVYANGQKAGEFTGKARFINGITGADAVTLGRTPRSSGNNYIFSGTISSIDVYSTLLTDEQLVSATSPKDRTPLNLTAETDGTSVTLAWNAPEGFTDISGYVVKLGKSTIAEVTGTQCTIDGFAANTEFTVEVCSKTFGDVLSEPVSVRFTTGEGNASGEAIVPDAPVNVKVSGIENDRAVISWTAPKDDSNVGGYVIKNGGEVIACVGADTTEYTVGELDASTEYVLTVYARYWNDASKLSQGVEAVFTTASDGVASKLSAADVDRDGKIDATDATLILQYFAKIITEFPENQ